MEASSHIDEHPRFRRLADYLASKAPNGKLPGRQHIEPLEIPDLLPWIMLIEVIAHMDAEPRYRIRLVGTEVVATREAKKRASMSMRCSTAPRQRRSRKPMVRLSARKFLVTGAAWSRA